MKIIFGLIGLLIAPAAMAAGTSGFVTPSEMTITFTRLSVVTADNKQITLLSGSFPTTFRKSDTDFAAVSLASITAPEGRFIGVQICYDTARTVKLNADVYHGAAGGSIANGNSLYSTGTVSTTAGSITTAVTASPTTLTGYVVGSGDNNCSSSYFATPVCVSADASHCQAGDNQVDPGTTVPNLNIMLDLFNSVGVDAINAALDNHIPVYPYPTIGRPGAAIHLTNYGGSGEVYNTSLLIGNDKKLLYAASYGANTSNTAGFCSGNGFTDVTAGPAGAFINSYGPTAVLDYNSTSGKVQFVAGNCPSGSACGSSGMVTLDNINVNQASTAAVTCVADTSASPSKLGYTYTAGAGQTGTTAMTVSKIIDPGNILGHCASSPCGTY